METTLTEMHARLCSDEHTPERNANTVVQTQCDPHQSAVDSDRTYLLCSHCSIACAQANDHELFTLTGGKMSYTRYSQPLPTQNDAHYWLLYRRRFSITKNVIPTSTWQILTKTLLLTQLRFRALFLNSSVKVLRARFCTS